MAGYQTVMFHISCSFFLQTQLPVSLKVWVDSCFCSSNDCRKASFSLLMQSIGPTKVHIFGDFSSLFPGFFERKGAGDKFSV